MSKQTISGRRCCFIIPVVAPNELTPGAVLQIVQQYARAMGLEAGVPVATLTSLAQKYQQAGKRLHLRYLSPDCYELLQKAKSMVEINLLEDPRYHVVDDQIS
jgi:SulP family sulfate permease